MEIKNFSEVAKLELYDAALSNAKTDSKMNDPLQMIGVSNEALEEGSTLLSNATKGRLFHFVYFSNCNIMNYSPFPVAPVPHSKGKSLCVSYTV